MNTNWLIPTQVSFSLLGKCLASLIVCVLITYQSLNPFIPWLYNLGLASSILFSVVFLTFIHRIRKLDHPPLFNPLPKYYYQAQFLTLSVVAFGLLHNDWIKKERLLDMGMIGLSIYFGVLFIGSLLQTKTHPPRVP